MSMVAQSLQGIAASPGIAIGPIFHYRPRRVMAEHYPIDDVDGEIVRLEQALAEARRELDALSIQMRDGIGPREAAIFEAHRMFLDDPELLGRVWARLQTDRVNAEYAWQEGEQHYAAALEALGAPAIVRLGDAVRRGPEGVRAIVDGANGTLLIGPDEAAIAEYRQRAEAFRQMRDSAFGVAEQP